MAIRVSPKHFEEYPIGDLTKEQFLALAIEVVGRLEWKIEQMSQSGLIATTGKESNTTSERIIIRVVNEVAHIQSISVTSVVLDWGKNRKNVEILKMGYEEQRQNYTRAELDIKYQKLKEQFSDQEDRLQISKPQFLDKVKEFVSFFIPTEGYYATPILLTINVAIYILMVVCNGNTMQFNSEVLLDWGANYRPLTLGGEWWRVMSSSFVHASLINILLNMAALIYIGTLLEERIGKLRILISYILTATLSAATSLWWNGNIVSAGSSGAMVGLYGIVLALASLKLVDKTKLKSVLLTTVLFFGYNIVYGLKGDVDNAANIGGFVSGIIIGYMQSPSIFKSKNTKLEFGINALLIYVIVVVIININKVYPYDLDVYNQQMKNYEAKAELALSVMKNSGKKPQNILLQQIKELGIANLKENIKLLNSFQTLVLPKNIRNKNKILKEYCELRIRKYDLTYRAISEKSDKYRSEMEAVNAQIRAKESALENE